MKLDLCFPPRVDIQEDMKPVLIKNRVSLSFIGFSFAMKMPLIPYSLHLKGQSKVVLTFWYLFGKLSFLKNVNVYYWLIKEADLNTGCFSKIVWSLYWFPLAKLLHIWAYKVYAIFFGL